jgi:hypothetical protein
MLNRKWTMYILHHSHTDIGYTDLQEKIIYNHIDYIKTAVNTTKKVMKKGQSIKISNGIVKLTTVWKDSWKKLPKKKNRISMQWLSQTI